MNILFVGNSYTYYNDMPVIFQALARENGKDVTVTAVTKGARRLDAYRFTEDATTQKLVDALAQQRYDVCFLQEQSVLPAQNYDSFAEGIRIVSGLLGDRVDRVVLYATWGRKAGHKTLESNGWDTETMAKLLSDSYEKAGAEFGFTVSPVGEIRLRPRKSGDSIRLSGGSKSLKKLFIDRKIPALQRENLPVLADDKGVVGVYGIGIHLDRLPCSLPAMQIHFEPIHSSGKL